MRRAIFILSCLQSGLWAQEASSGFELRATIAEAVSYSHALEAAPRLGNPVTGGFRSVLYPTWKLNKNWTVAGAIQAHSRPYFIEQFSTEGYGLKADVLQAHLSYSKFWKNGSVVARMGQLSSAFGSFLLRYDDAVNPLIDMPMAYGYYYKPVSTLGLTGAQLDVTQGKLDARAQFTTSSPANRRGIADREQYGAWTGGAGYTIMQGLRVGVSAYRGAYLHRQHRFYFRGEAKPRDLPGSGYGLDLQWGRGPWNVQAELQKFQFAYLAIPTFNEHTGYAEARRVVHPRLYVAARTSYIRANKFPGYEACELGVGIRPNRYQLVKAGYQLVKGHENTFAVQYVTSFRAISIARD